jgi:uncharacterized membrane protein (UPF0136 family)
MNVPLLEFRKWRYRTLVAGAMAGIAFGVAYLFTKQSVTDILIAVVVGIAWLLTSWEMGRLRPPKQEKTTEVNVRLPDYRTRRYWALVAGGAAGIALGVARILTKQAGFDLLVGILIILGGAAGLLMAWEITSHRRSNHL